jgi:hypothetical protein
MLPGVEVAVVVLVAVAGGEEPLAAGHGTEGTEEKSEF